MATELHPGLQKSTIPHYMRGNFVDISLDQQEYLFAAAIQRNAERSMGTRADKSRYVINFGLPVEVKAWGGSELVWNVKVAHGDNFAWVTGSTPVNIDRRDYEEQARIPFRMCRVHYSCNEEELADCRSAEEITNLKLARKLGAEQDFAKSFENWGWGAPPPSSDTETAYPLRYYLFTEPESTVGSYTTFTSLIRQGNGNFLNVNHGSYTSGPAGLSRATYQQWGNWNCQYTNFADDDYVEKFTCGCLKIGFRSPVSYPRLDNAAPNQAVYTTTANLLVKARLARQQNDQNTSDLQSRFNDVELFQVPHYAVPQFDSSSFSLYSSSNKDVAFLIDWSSWAWITKQGFDFYDRKYTGQLQAPLDETYVRYLKGNLTCWNPRRNAVLSK